MEEAIANPEQFMFTCDGAMTPDGLVLDTGKASELGTPGRNSERGISRGPDH
jgi:hypothetical protein